MAAPPSQWLIDLQTAWARGALLPYEKALDVQAQVSGGEWVPAADVVSGKTGGFVFVRKN